MSVNTLFMQILLLNKNVKMVLRNSSTMFLGGVRYLCTLHVRKVSYLLYCFSLQSAPICAAFLMSHDMFMLLTHMQGSHSNIV